MVGYSRSVFLRVGQPSLVSESKVEGPACMERH